jgi:hypothetical protein
MLNNKHTLKEVSPPPLWLPHMRKTPNRCYIIIHNAGAVWANRALSPSSSNQPLEFHINGKGILPSQKNLC